MLTLIAIACLLASAIEPPPQNTKADAAKKTADANPVAQTGGIVGQLTDTRNRITYVGNAVVFLCDARSGYPIHRETKTPIQFSRDALDLKKFWYAETEENGSFAFRGVLVGEYRLVAQSWSGTRGMPEITGKTSAFVMLHGVAENIRVRPDEETIAHPRQLGNGMIRIRNDPEEAHAFLLMSQNPVIGDAILGPALWGDAFVSRLIGVTHMEQPHVTVFGLPDDHDLHVALFNYDNNPGVGAGSFPAGQREGILRIVASWSNGHHNPPPELSLLTDFLEKRKLTPADFLLPHEKLQDPARQQQKILELLRQNPNRHVIVPGMNRQKLADVVAAFAYVRLRAHTRK